jgi:hypothetical protein
MMSVDEMAERLQSLSRMAAVQAAATENLPVVRKCQEAARLFLEILDGKTPYFPKCALNPHPHIDDIAEAKADDLPWFDMDTHLLDDLSTRFSSLTRGEGQDFQDWLCRRDGAYTGDEVTGLFLHSALRAAHYWGEMVHQKPDGIGYSDLDRCDGTVFSILNILDGTNIATPMFDVAPDIEDIRARPGLCEFQSLVLDTYLHNRFYQVEVFDPSATVSPNP